MGKCEDGPTQSGPDATRQPAAPSARSLRERKTEQPGNVLNGKKVWKIEKVDETMEFGQNPKTTWRGNVS